MHTHTTAGTAAGKHAVLPAVDKALLCNVSFVGSYRVREAEEEPCSLSLPSCGGFGDASRCCSSDAGWSSNVGQASLWVLPVLLARAIAHLCAGEIRNTFPYVTRGVVPLCWADTWVGHMACVTPTCFPSETYLRYHLWPSLKKRPIFRPR